MARTNGKSEVNAPQLDLDHELNSAADTEQNVAGVDPQESGGGVPAFEDELSRLRSERDTLLDRLARSQAEFDNARKRAAREQQEYREYAVTDAVKALLPILDSFERALQSAQGETGDFRSGVELIHKQLLDALARLGVQPIPAQGMPFDPRLHQAIEMVETDEVPDHHVLDELQRGYKMKDRLVRPAMVRVAKARE